MTDIKLPHDVVLAIDRFDKAVGEYVWRGSAHPNDRQSIIDEYHNARKSLNETIWRYIPEDDDDTEEMASVGRDFMDLVNRVMV